MNIIASLMLFTGMAGCNMDMAGAGSKAQKAFMLKTTQSETHSGSNQGERTGEDKGFAVVELFTSQGCSSCPSADRVLGELAAEYADRPVLFLEEHVDYWNRLGWKDPFSESLFTERQRDFSNSLHTDQVYTPQALVNGSVEMTGSNKAKLKQAVEAALSDKREPGNYSLQAKLNRKEVQVAYQAELKDGDKLAIILIQAKATIEVKNGENGGRTLNHHQVVRAWKNVTAANGNVRFDIPEGFQTEGASVASIVQDRNGKVIGMGQAKI